MKKNGFVRLITLISAFLLLFSKVNGQISKGQIVPQKDKVYYYVNKEGNSIISVKYKGDYLVRDFIDPEGYEFYSYKEYGDIKGFEKFFELQMELLEEAGIKHKRIANDSNGNVCFLNKDEKLSFSPDFTKLRLLDNINNPSELIINDYMYTTVEEILK